jgi:hypothetical protein
VAPGLAAGLVLPILVESRLSRALGGARASARSEFSFECHLIGRPRFALSQGRPLLRIVSGILLRTGPRSGLRTPCSTALASVRLDSRRDRFVTSADAMPTALLPIILAKAQTANRCFGDHRGMGRAPPNPVEEQGGMGAADRSTLVHVVELVPMHSGRTDRCRAWRCSRRALRREAAGCDASRTNLARSEALVLRDAIRRLSLEARASNSGRRWTARMLAPIRHPPPPDDGRPLGAAPRSRSVSP